MEKWKSVALKHLPTGIIITILISMTAYLSTDKLEDFAKADAACLQKVETNCSNISSIEKRVDKLEIILPYTTDAIRNNTKAIEKLTAGVQEIKTLMLSNIKSREDEKWRSRLCR